MYPSRRVTGVVENDFFLYPEGPASEFFGVRNLAYFASFLGSEIWRTLSVAEGFFFGRFYICTSRARLYVLRMLVAPSLGLIIVTLRPRWRKQDSTLNTRPWSCDKYIPTIYFCLQEDFCLHLLWSWYADFSFKGVLGPVLLRARTGRLSFFFLKLSTGYDDQVLFTPFDRLTYSLNAAGLSRRTDSRLHSFTERLSQSQSPIIRPSDAKHGSGKSVPMTHRGCRYFFPCGCHMGLKALELVFLRAYGGPSIHSLPCWRKLAARSLRFTPLSFTRIPLPATFFIMLTTFCFNVVSPCSSNIVDFIPSAWLFTYERPDT